MRAGMTFSAFLDDTSFAAGYLECRSPTTMIRFDEGIGPKRSTATIS